MSKLPPSVQGMLWASAAGLTFAMLNTIMRKMSIELPPTQALFLRYAFGLVAVLPVLFRHGLGYARSNALKKQLARGVVHSIGLGLWFSALPHLPLPYTTALGFTGPIFIMLGAALMLGEKMFAARWVAVIIGFIGVLVIVGPNMGAANFGYSLLMLAAAPVFAASFLMAKVLTRHDKPGVIVLWQALTVTVFSMPFALWVWVAPSPEQWFWFAVAGMLGSFGHWCLTRAYSVADISSAQPVKFLDLIWASALGFAIFGDIPATATLIGGTVIVIATIWVARRESQRERN